MISTLYKQASFFKLYRLLASPLRFLLPLLLVSSLGIAAEGDVVRIRSDSPLQYEVVSGDTLWDISGRFLEEPWLWPEVWQDNPQIVNPHLIYPGDLILLVYVDGEPRLTLQRGGDGERPVIRLSPGVRREPLLSPIQAISLEDIEAFLSRNRIAEVDEVESAPKVLGTQGGEEYSAEDDIVYALGTWTEGEKYYDIIRPEGEVFDRETGEVIGIVAIMLGEATMLTQEDDQGTLIVTYSIEEITKDDLFLPRNPVTFDPVFFPVPPAFDINAEVINIEFGKFYGGSKDTLIMDVGERDGIESGHLLTLKKADHELPNGPDDIRYFTGENFGKVLIYQVFRDFSLGLVLNSELAIELNDRAVTR